MVFFWLKRIGEFGNYLGFGCNVGKVAKIKDSFGHNGGCEMIDDHEAQSDFCFYKRIMLWVLYVIVWYIFETDSMLYHYGV